MFIVSNAILSLFSFLNIPSVFRLSILSAIFIAIIPFSSTDALVMLVTVFLFLSALSSSGSAFVNPFTNIRVFVPNSVSISFSVISVSSRVSWSMAAIISSLVIMMSFLNVSSSFATFNGWVTYGSPVFLFCSLCASFAFFIAFFIFSRSMLLIFSSSLISSCSAFITGSMFFGY